MARGGPRPGAGAPLGNSNAIKSGKYAKQKAAVVISALCRTGSHGLCRGIALVHPDSNRASWVRTTCSCTHHTNPTAKPRS